MKLGKIQVGSNIAQNIAHLAQRKSYLVIIGPNSDEKLTKSLLGQIQVGQTLLRITHLAHMKSYLVIICPNSHEKLTKSEIRPSYYLLQFGFIYTYLAP